MGALILPLRDVWHCTPVLHSQPVPRGFFHFRLFATRSLTGVCLSFNGGKDCTVILHLLFAVIDHCRATGALPASMTPFDVKAIYFETKDQFPEVVQFMHAMQQRYVSIHISKCNCVSSQGGTLTRHVCMSLRRRGCTRYGYEQMELCGSFKPALVALLEAHPIKAIVMGQRRIDPDATTLESISTSDVHRGWPEFLRINAILDWPYDAVWKFLLDFDLPYCSLYDLGYALFFNCTLLGIAIGANHYFSHPTRRLSFAAGTHRSARGSTRFPTRTCKRRRTS